MSRTATLITGVHTTVAPSITKNFVLTTMHRDIFLGTGGSRLIGMGKIANYTCQDEPSKNIEDIKPHNGHFSWHQRHDTPQCYLSREENSRYQYKWRYGTTEGWKGLGKRNNAPKKKARKYKHELPTPLVDVEQDVKKPKPPITPLNLDVERYTVCRIDGCRGSPLCDGGRCPPHHGELCLSERPKPLCQLTYGEVDPDFGKDRWGKEGSYVVLYRKEQT